MRVAVIPARGGSKRIPRKNIRPFAGKPMIAYSIECSIRSKLFDHIIVSTDDAEIAEISRDCGAEVPFMRPANLSDDLTFPAAVIAHAIDWLLSKGVKLSAVCCIFPTAPFIRDVDLLASFKIYETGKWDYVFSATDFAYPIFRSFRNKNSDGLEMFFPNYFNTRSQDLPKAFHDAGMFYWGRADAWLNNVTVFGPKSTVIFIPRWRVQDIDTLEDWERAEILLKVIQSMDSGK